MSTPLVKLQTTSDVSPQPNMQGFNLRHGSLVYTHKAKGGIGNIFMGNDKFFICDGDGDKAATKKFYIVFGAYEGRTERFSSLNYMHQRHAVLGNFGSTGHRRVDTAIRVVTAIGSPETIGRAILNPKKKYFVGFFSTDKTSPIYIMHNQIGKPIYFPIYGKKTLSEIYADKVAAFLQLA
jgi:hypothetical protein